MREKAKSHFKETHSGVEGNVWPFAIGPVTTSEKPS